MLAIKILKEQQLISINNFFHIKKFLERFSKKVLLNINQNSQDIKRNRERFKEELQNAERGTESKISLFRTDLRERADAQQAVIDTTFELIKDKQARIDAKLAQVEVTEVVLDYVNTEIRRLKMDMSKDLQDSKAETEDRF